MRTATRDEPLIESLEVSDRAILVRLVDGRALSIPLEWSWRLSNATPAERANFSISGGGAFVHWPDLDEDLSAQGMLTGTPAPRPEADGSPASLAKSRIRVARKGHEPPRKRSASD
ncbi:MAG: DUF2442 domain-containing protein [Myxococcota bacterium]